MAVVLWNEKTINRIVSHVDGVVATVADEAKDVGDKAKARMAAARDNTNRTNHEVDVTHGDVDSFVNLEGPAPLSVEFGHFYDNGEIEADVKYIPGKYIITGAAGLTG